MTNHSREVTVAAAAIIDLMSGNSDWRKNLEDSDFLESADWLTACEYAKAAIASMPAEQEPVPAPCMGMAQNCPWIEGVSASCSCQRSAPSDQEKLIAAYDTTYAGGMGASSRAFLRRFLEWQSAHQTGES